MTNRYFWGFFLLPALSLGALVSVAKSPDPTKVLIQSDEIDYNSETNIVKATGHVFMYDQSRILSSDKVTYNRKTGQALVEDESWIREPSGDFIFTPYADFTNQFKDGYMRDPRVLMTDDSRLAANEAKRFNGEKNIFRQAVYSPCHLCKAKPEKPPLWQLKADKTIHSIPDQIMIYHHARLEMFGVPVFYLPYFRHADNTVQRKSGFLMPTYGTSSDLGALISTPFYYVISDNRDLTFVPIFTAKQGVVVSGEFRHRLIDGEYKVQGSYTKSKHIRRTEGVPVPQEPSSDRWHFMTDGRYDLDDDHLFTFDINRASDTTYLRRYPVLPKGNKLKAQIKNLTSTVAVEEFKQHNYGVIRAYNLQTDSPGTTPLILPQASYSYQTDPGRLQDVFTFDANLLALTREREIHGLGARRMQRISLGGGWRVPYVTKGGQVWTLRLNARGDGYSISHFTPRGSQKSVNEIQGRLYPQATLDWRYPFYKLIEEGIWTVEPMAMIAAAPQGGNSNHFPNEDSLNTQLEDSSLFLPNRFNGIDRVDGGQRAVYGFKTGLAMPQQRRMDIFLGQSMRLDRHSVLGANAGEDRHASDIVGRVRVRPTDWLSLIFRTAVNHRNMRPRIAETTMTLGKPILKFTAVHTFQSKRTTPTGLGVSQINWGVSSTPFEYWTFAFGETRNLKRHNSGALCRTVSAIYKDECFTMTLSAFKSGYRDRDIKPSSGIMLQFDFKNLGTVAPLSFLGLQTDNVI